MVITVKRSEWARGQGGLQSSLLRSDGMKCCVGFLCLQSGMKEEYIRDIGTAYTALLMNEGAANPVVSAIEAGLGFDRAYTVNDSRLLDDPERERLLNEWASKRGHSFVFVD